MTMNTNIEIEMTITEAARRHIENMIAKEAGIGLRLTIKKTGCSGFSYQPQIIHAANAINPKDIIVNAFAASSCKIFVDATWVHLLNGVQIDFVEEEKNGLMQKRLLFINPKETSRCGCGESFHVE